MTSTVPWCPGALVPFAALPPILTAITGVVFSILDKQDSKAEGLLAIHTGPFGPINLQPEYSYFLGVCVLILVITAALLWCRFRSHKHHRISGH